MSARKGSGDYGGIEVLWDDLVGHIDAVSKLNGKGEIL